MCAARVQVVALFFVCAFGSSLDVAAIQAESPEPLNFNHELQTVGASIPCSQQVYVHRVLGFQGLGMPDPLDFNHELQTVGAPAPFFCSCSQQVLCP